jgi:MFS family permease
VVGVNEITPLALNVLAGLGLLFAIHHLLRRHDAPALYSLFALLAVIVLVPLNTLIIAGMEHVLHILLVVLFAGYAADLLAKDRAPLLSSWASMRLFALGALVGTARYEGLFLVLIFYGLFALRWRLAYAVLLGALSAAPVVVYGLIAAGNGWDFLPTSLSTKSDAGYLAQASPGALFTYFVVDTYNIFTSHHVLTTLVLAAFFLYLFRYEKVRTAWDAGLVLLVAFVLIAFINVRLVSWPWVGTFARYEAYLVALALVVIPAALGRWLPRSLSLRALPAYIMALGLVMLVGKDIYDRYTFVAYENPIVTATRDIYQQQYQMARFLAAYYQGEVVAANDIGAINYYAEIDNIDLWGLGTIEIARARSQGRYDTAEIARITAERGGKIAVIYDTWFDEFGGLPDEWVRVGEWRLTRPPVILGSDTVVFYAIDPAEAEALAANLEAFALRLPDGVASTVR